jgi:hypothetical protein
MERRMDAEQLVQVGGALFILAAYVLGQLGRLDPTTMLYQVLNLVGSTILTILAVFERQWGFFLLEFVWAIVSCGALVNLLRGRPASSAHG